MLTQHPLSLSDTDTGTPCSGYDCQNGQCIPSSYHCDGYTDCYNGYDELNCYGTTSYTYSTTTSESTTQSSTTTTTQSSTTTTEAPPSCNNPYTQVGDRCLYFEVFLAGNYGSMNYACSEFAAKPIIIDDANDLYEIVQFINDNGEYWME